MNNFFAKKTNYAFWQTILAGFIAVAAMFFLSLKAYQLSSLYLSVLIHKIKDTCGCENMAQFFSMHPDIFRAVILFGIGMGIFICHSLYKLAKLSSQTKKHNAYYLSLERSRRSSRLKAAAKSLSLSAARIIEINSPDPLAFCFGFWQPKICVSRVLTDMLDKNELKVVLAHEAQHMSSCEPLKLFIVKYLRSVFFFLPGIKNFAKKYITFSELSADEKASENSSERSSLARAILKISEQEEHGRRASGASLSFLSLAMEERANRLSDGFYEPEFNFIDRSLVAGSLGLAIVSFLVIFIFSNSTRAFEMHHIANCVEKDSFKNDLFCDPASHQYINDESNIGNVLRPDDFSQDSACKNH